VVIPKAMAYATVAVLAALFLSPFIALMPHAALAGVVIVYSLGLIQPAEFRDMLRVRRTEFIWAVIAMLGVMTLGTLQGILVAIIVSLVALGKVANPRVYVLGREPGTTKFDLEYSALKMLIEAEARGRAAGIELWLGAMQPEVLAVVKRSPLGEALGDARMFTSIDSAVKKFRRQYGEPHA
jgi:SulP family sulfate permease